MIYTKRTIKHTLIYVNDSSIDSVWVDTSRSLPR